ncbi:MAG: hypothetical protein ACUVUE_06060 [Candidatus Bathycorpusculaceae bacterium]
MEKSASPLRLDDGQNLAGSQCFRCEECGEEFQAPILATVSSGSTAEEYYACPRCLSKMNNAEKCEGKMEGKRRENTNDVNGIEKPEESTVCSHELGYLKRRPRDMPIPEECLVCDKMIECLTF